MKVSVARALLWLQAASTAFGRVRNAYPAAQYRKALQIEPEETSEITYPTTLTSVWSTTTSVKATDFPRLVIRTVTQYEYWETTQDLFFNFTMLQTEISNQKTIEIQGDATKTLEVMTETVTSTWILWEPAGTDLPVGNEPNCNSGCTQSAWKADKRCLQQKEDTACAAQCSIRDYVWWCYKRDFVRPDEPAMGRVCWNSNGTTVRQLLEPCDAADHRADCLACAD